MKRIIAIAFVLCGLCHASFAEILFFIEAPKDVVQARAGVCGRPELKPLHAMYNDIIQTRLWPLKRDDVAKVFGPKIETVENRTGSGLKLPADLVLPIFAPAGGSNCTGGMMMMVSGLVVPDDHSHTDLHAIGDVGYVEFYYQWDGKAIATALVYFRADDKFVPLATTNDFSKRLEWERGKFDALKKWLDQHLPKQTELGLVEVSESNPRRLDLGGGAACILTTRVIHHPSVTNLWYTIDIRKENPDPKESKDWQNYSIVFRFTKIWEEIIVIIGEKWIRRILINQERVDPRFA